MSARSGRDEVGRRHLVVCCASGDRAVLAPALDLLAGRGYELAVFEGAQQHTPALLEHVQRHGPASIYVLAKSTTLHAPRLARLMTALECADVQPEQIIEHDIDWRDPMALVEKVSAAQASVPAPALAPAPAEPLATGPRQVVPPRAPARRAGSREPTGPRRAVTIGAPTAAAAPSSTPTLPPDAAATSASPSATRTLPPAPEVRRIAPAPALPPETAQSLPLPLAKTLPPDTGRTLPPATAQVLASAPPQVLPPATAQTLAPSASTSAGRLPIPSSPSPRATVVATHAPAPATGPSPSPAASVPSASSMQDLERAPTFGAWRGVTASLRPIVAATGGWIGKSRSRLVGAGAGALLLVAVTIGATSLGGADDAGAADPDGEAVGEPAAAENEAPSDADEPSDEASADPDDAPDDAPEPGNSDRAPTEAKKPAPRSGEHEGIVYAPLHPPKRSFAAAEAQCAEMNGGAEGPWRLPTLAEVHALSKAHVLERGVYWSSTEAGAFGDKALVWSEKKSRAAPIGKKWGGGRAVCIKASE